MDPNSPKALPIDEFIASINKTLSEVLYQISRSEKKRKGADASIVDDLETSLRSKLESLKIEAKEVKKSLDEQSKEIELKRAQIENELNQIKAIQEYQDQNIKLNVGGTIFEVAKSTLMKEKDSMLSIMFSGRFPLVKGEDQAYFIDRDPTYFRFILNYLRDDGSLTIPDTNEGREDLLKEAYFYQLVGLIALLTGRIVREKELGPENLKMRDEENRVRNLFITEPNCDEIANPYCHLIDVFKEKSTFKYVTTESELPLMFDYRIPPVKGTDSVVDSLTVFKESFHKETQHLNGLDWKGLFAAGGSVLAALLPATDDKVFQSSDIDLFLCGMTSDEAIAKIAHIYEVILKNAGKVVVLRTNRTLTFAAGYPHRHVQIVLRLYKTPAEVLLGFDLDCVGVGYDGDRVWSMPRARRALNYRYNIADPSRQTYRTTSYEYRLWKYSKRGFAVAVPGFKRSYVNSEIYLKRYQELNGFAKLLFLEERDYQLGVLKLYDGAGFRSWFERHGFSIKRDKLTEDSMTLLDQEVVGHVIDYNNGVLLPFTPITDTDSIYNRLLSRAKSCVDVEKHKQIREEKEAKFKLDPDSYNMKEEKQWSLKFGRRPYLVPDLYFIFGRSLESVLDIDNFKTTLPKSTFNVKVSKNIEFIGSLAEYVSSLPDVDDDWYKDALLKFPVSETEVM